MITNPSFSSLFDDAITQDKHKQIGNVYNGYRIIISIFLNPLLEYLEKKSKLSRKKSIAVIYGTLILLLSLILFLGVPLFLNNIRNLTTEVPNYIEKLKQDTSGSAE